MRRVGVEEGREAREVSVVEGRREGKCAEMEWRRDGRKNTEERTDDDPQQDEQAYAVITWTRPATNAPPVSPSGRLAISRSSCVLSVPDKVAWKAGRSTTRTAATMSRTARHAGSSAGFAVLAMLQSGGGTCREWNQSK